ncbi:MAG TPA: hypothetical protein VLV16_06730 [Gemmatimonadales bacterium]|nr:hypothetical protein [Gemmatimonadales bacterium]
MRSLRFVLVALLAPSLLVARVGAPAQSPPASKALAITAQNLTAVAKGRDVKGMARPGDEIRYSLVFTNTQQVAVKNVQFVDPIPQGMVYVLGSASIGQAGRVAYSIDGGKTYSAQPTVETMENGQKISKPAPRELYTHVRWTVLDAVAPGAQVTAELRAQVSAAPGEAK